MLNKCRMLMLVTGMVLLLGGWSAGDSDGSFPKIFVGQRHFDRQMNRISSNINAGRWQLAAEEAASLQADYHDHKWLIQLVGDESEYEGIQIELHKLRAAIGEKDKTQTKVSLAALKGYFDGVYEF